MFSRIRPDSRIALIPPKSLIFRILCALFEQIPFGMNILKNPTLCGAKDSYKLRVPSHLVTWIQQCPLSPMQKHIRPKLTLM